MSATDDMWADEGAMNFAIKTDHKLRKCSYISYTYSIISIYLMSTD